MAAFGLARIQMAQCLHGCKLSCLPIDLVVIGLLYMAYLDGNIPAEAQTLPNEGYWLL